MMMMMTMMMTMMMSLMSLMMINMTIIIMSGMCWVLARAQCRSCCQSQNLGTNSLKREETLIARCMHGSGTIRLVDLIMFWFEFDDHDAISIYAWWRNQILMITCLCWCDHIIHKQVWKKIKQLSISLFIQNTFTFSQLSRTISIS